MSSTGHESRFQIQERLGRGGTAEVFRVRLTGSGRLAALKRPLPDPPQGIDFNLLARRELSLIGTRRFPGLVRILNTAADGGDYLLLELCEGKTLDQLGRITDVRLALNILAAVAADLEYLRQHQIIHGDLKPQNIFLPRDLERCTTDKLFFAKLSDFSLGRSECEHDSVRAGLGTVGYMAPETIVDGRADHQSDLFALGVIAYQMLTGRHPFIATETDPLRINARVREEEPTPIDQLTPGIPKPVVELIDGLLMKQPEQRPPTALAVCMNLRQVGATYPFERLLRPKYIIESKSDYVGAANCVAELSERQSKRLSHLTQNSLSRLRSLLEINHSRQNLLLTETGLQFSGNIYWPAGFRRLDLHNFRTSTLGQRKRMIRAAVCSTQGSTPFDDLILTFLRPATIRRLSRSAASQAEKTGQYATATILYVRTGDLESADRCAYQAASLLRGEHRSREAILCINSVLDLAAMRNAIRSVLPLLMLRGDIQKETGLVDDALATYLQIVSLYADLPADKLLAETYRDLGDLYKMKQDSKAGLEALNQALTIYRQMGEDLELSRTYNNLGNSYFYAGDLPSTLQHYRRALHIQRNLNAETEIASTLSNMGSVYCMKGNLTRGVLLLDKSLELKKNLGDAGEIARTLNNLGYVRYLQGQYDRSAEQLRESLAINQRIGSKKEELFNLENLTMVLLEAGQLREALTFLDRGLELAIELNQLPHQIVFRHSLAMVHMRLGKLRDSASCLREVELLLEQVEDVHWKVQLPLTYALLALVVNDRPKARQLTQSGIEASVTAGVRPLQLAALLQMCRLDPEPSIQQQAGQLAKEFGKETDQVVAAFNRTELFLESEQTDLALSTLPDLRAAMHRIPHYIERPRLAAILVELLLLNSELSEARAIAVQCRDEARKFGLMSEQAHSLLLLGRINARNGDIEKAYANYRQSLQIMKDIAGSITCDSDKVLFQQKRTVQFLVSEIRRLSSLLDQKQRAGTPALQ